MGQIYCSWKNTEQCHEVTCEIFCHIQILGHPEFGSYAVLLVTPTTEIFKLGPKSQLFALVDSFRSGPTNFPKAPMRVSPYDISKWNHFHAN